MTRNTFWEELEKWPTDPPGWLFLGRASILVGDKIFDGWAEKGFVERWRLGWSVANHDAAIARGKAREKSWSESDAAKEIWDRNRQQYTWHSGRVDCVQEQIREWAERGDLVTAVRETGGGPLAKLDPVVWSTQTLSARFYCCQMNPENPYGQGVFGDKFQHIFVDQGQLLRLLHPELVAPSHDTDLSTSSDGVGDHSAAHCVGLADERVAEQQSEIVARRVSQKRVEDWFRDVRCPEFENKAPPNRKACLDAAKAYFAPDIVVRSVLVDARREAAPSYWQKTGPSRRAE